MMNGKTPNLVAFLYLSLIISEANIIHHSSLFFNLAQATIQKKQLLYRQVFVIIKSVKDLLRNGDQVKNKFIVSIISGLFFAIPAYFIFKQIHKFIEGALR